MSLDLAALREEYTQASLDIDTVLPSPFTQFEKWFKEAEHAQIKEPNAMVLATSDSKGLTTQRTVLLKAFDTKGFVFYTNYGSNKAKQITQNPQVSILFPWYELERQVIINGLASKVSTAESLKYFASRPRGSQLGAWVSHQSSTINTRNVLEMKLKEMTEKFKEGAIPLPEFWGGFRIVPEAIEFWQGRRNRLHDRIHYTLSGDEWTINRLSP